MGFQSFSSRCLLSIPVYAALLTCLNAQAGALCEIDPKHQYQSTLVADAQGACWFQDGNDGETAFSLARDMSFDRIGIVIVAMATPDMAERAARFAQKLAGWLTEQKDMPDHVPVVARMLQTEGSSVAFKIYVDGGAYSDSNHELGMYNIEDVQNVLPRIVASFKAAMIMRLEARQQASE